MYGVGTWGALPWGATPAAVFPTAGSFERILIFNGLLSDQGTVTAEQTAAVAASNLLTMHPSRKWRSTLAYDALLIDLPRPASVNAAVLCAHNLGQAGLLRMRGFSSSADRAAKTSPLFDTDYVSAWPLGVKPNDEEWENHLSLIRWAAKTVKYLRLDVSDPSVSRLEAGRLMVCSAWQPGVNIDFEPTFGFEPADIQMASDYGGLYAEQRPQKRYLEVKWSNLGWNDANRFAADLHRRLGMSRDLVCIVDPSETGDFHTQAIHGLYAERGYRKPLAIWGSDGRMMWTTEMKIRELLW